MGVLNRIICLGGHKCHGFFGREEVKTKQYEGGRLVCSSDSSPLNNIRLCFYSVNFVFGIRGILFLKGKWIGFGNQTRDPESLTGNASKEGGDCSSSKEEGTLLFFLFILPLLFFSLWNHFPHCLCCLLTQVGLAAPIYLWMNFTWQSPFLLRLLWGPLRWWFSSHERIKASFVLPKVNTGLSSPFSSAWEAVCS